MTLGGSSRFGPFGSVVSLFWCDCWSSQSHATKFVQTEAGPCLGLGVNTVSGSLSRCHPPNMTELSVSSIDLRNCRGGPSLATQVCKQNQVLLKNKLQGKQWRVNLGEAVCL